ncbi:amidase [Sneathiella chungangensis]|uniref:Amidase n=1 Tax=Sneathiella chungangensis TaxID=1418234 RepID=A0A845M9F2_9PROT|nr:amidase [Sneathiella chungangensis]MZR20915.1 amidase [Sneathiella chungangensis]
MPSTKAPIWQQSATEIAKSVTNRELTAYEVTEAVLARIAEVDNKINAYACVDAPGALAAAKELDATIADGKMPGPLAGVPFSVKDLVITKGVETAFGSHIFAGNIPDVDAEAVARLRRAGAILVGKSNTPEFGIKALTNNPRHGYTRNPWKTDRSPGGSSGGATCAVAAGMGPIAVTTDGAGSSRIPAAVCGVLGLKPTLGRIPNETAIELFSSFVNLGISSRTTDDLALGLTVMCGEYELDPWSIKIPQEEFKVSDNGDMSMKGLKVLTFRKMGNRLLDNDVEALFNAQLDRLREQGATIDDGSDDFDWDKLPQMAAMRSYQHARLSHYLDEHRDIMDPILVDALEEGAKQNLLDVQSAPAKRSDLFRRVQSLFSTYDVIATPTVSAPPPYYDHTQNDPIYINNELAGPLRANWYGYTGTFNHTGHPAINIPMGFTSDGLPSGLHVVGRWFDEQRLLDIANTLSKLAPWHNEWPTL